MFSNRCFARAAASHWLSPSVSMPTSRWIMRCAMREVRGASPQGLRLSGSTNLRKGTLPRVLDRSAASFPETRLPARTSRLAQSSILVGVSECDVPAIGVLVEVRRDVGTVDLDDELHRRLDHEVARFPEDLAEAGVQRKGADFVRVRLARFTIDPMEQRREPFLVVRVRQEIDEQRHAPARLV